MSKKVKKWEPETTKAFGWEMTSGGGIAADVGLSKVSIYEIPVRIIREKDYQKLLRLAHKKESRNG